MVLSALETGGEIKDGILSKRFSTPIPSLADISKISSSLDPIKLKICFFTDFTSASIESILFKTGMISNPASIAAYECANVCA